MIRYMLKQLNNIIMEKYVLVSFPEIQYFMEHSRWSECILCQEIEGHPCEDSTYAVPEDLYYQVTREIKDQK